MMILYGVEQSKEEREVTMSVRSKRQLPPPDRIFQIIFETLLSLS
jgi:hypothetical protein